jgi:hypothetical protein
VKTMTCTEEEQLEFEKREARITEFLEKVQNLQEEYRDAVTAMSVAVLTVQEQGQTRTYGGWSVPPHQDNRAYHEIADLLIQETQENLEDARQLSGDCDGNKRIQYDA